MNPKRICAVTIARTREFYRDTTGLGWNLVMPVIMVLGLAFIFNNPDESFYTIGFIGDAESPMAEPLMALRYVNFVRQTDEASGISKVRHHRLDLFVDLRQPIRYWVNDASPRGYLTERLVRSTVQADTSLQRQAVSGRAIRYVDWVLPGVLAVNLMISSFWGVGWVIVRYRKNGVLRRLRATPLSAGEFLVAQILSRLLVVVCVSLIVFVGTDLLLDFPMRGSWPALVLVFLSGSMALISIALAVAARISSEELADGLLNILSWPMMMLSGVWFSLEGTNIWAQRIAEFLPLTHIVNAARRVMLDGAGVGDVMPETSLLLAITALLLTASARAFRWQ